MFGAGVFTCSMKWSENCGKAEYSAPLHNTNMDSLLLWLAKWQLFDIAIDA